MKLRKKEKTLTMAAAKAGLWRKTARKYLKSGNLPSQCQPERYWRTRSDPFQSVWRQRLVRHCTGQIEEEGPMPVSLNES